MNIRIFLKSFAIAIIILTASLNGKSSSIKLIVTHNTNSINNDSIKILQLEQRIKEIQNINLSDLSPVEKKNLSSELKNMLKEAKSYKSAYEGTGTHTGIYISLGALIIIILLLILILR